MRANPPSLAIHMGGLRSTFLCLLREYYLCLYDSAECRCTADGCRIWSNRGV